MINEGAKILEEGIAIRPSDIDITWINGYNWPKYRGGPMWYADRMGIPQLVARLEELQSQYGDRWAPADLLKQMVADGKTFADLN